MNLKKMQLVSFIWGAILIIIVIALTIFGFWYKSLTKEYKEFEKTLVEKTKEYCLDKVLLNNNNMKITLDELKEEKVLENLKIKDTECEGYIEIQYTKENYKYSPFIKCGNYKTKGYKE